MDLCYDNKEDDDMGAMECTPRGKSGECEYWPISKKEIDRKRISASVREICHAVGLKSAYECMGFLNALEEQGYIRRDATKPRALEVVDAPKGRSVPLVGKVTAGQPILAQENIEEYLILPQNMSGRDDQLFALRGRGQHDRGGHFHRRYSHRANQNARENGDIVVAMIDREAW